MASISAVKGMNDILPKDVWRWHHIERVFQDVAATYGFREVRTPIVEPTQLFLRSIGEATDIVEKEMYSFVDKGDDALTIRPEGTASAVRAYIEHSVHADEPISKWYYLGPMFRRERPARGRYRQFYQAGVEVFGDAGPFVDAEVIALAVRILEKLGIQDIEVLLNSLGTGDTKARYREKLLTYLTPFSESLSPDSKRRLGTNPLRVLDSKIEKDREICQNAPRLHDVLTDEDRAHFDSVKNVLTRLGIRFREDANLVRGLDYYSRTLFEIQGRGGELGAQNALCGGGRYDGLMRELGGQDLPSIGFAMGLERLLLAMGESKEPQSMDVALVVEPGNAESDLRLDAAAFADSLRALGLRVESDLRGQSLKSQFRRADRIGAAFVVLFAGNEWKSGRVKVKDLAAHAEQEFELSLVPQHLLEKIAGKK